MKVVLSPNPYRDRGLKAALRASAILEQGGIDALFINREVEAYRGILTDETLEYIQNNYQIVSVDSQGRSLWKLI